MEQDINKEIVDELMDIKGKARGVHFKNDADFVLFKKGENGLEKVKEKLKEWGHPINYEEVNQFDFYPVGLRALSLLAIKKSFEWSDKEIKELCSYAVKFSWITKLLVRYFFSLDKVSKEVPKIWSRYFTEGQAEIKEYNLDEKYAILEIKDFSLHPIYCRCLEGVIEGIMKMITGSKNINCEEINCTFKGAKEHKYLIKWE